MEESTLRRQQGTKLSQHHISLNDLWSVTQPYFVKKGLSAFYWLKRDQWYNPSSTWKASPIDSPSDPHLLRVTLAKSPPTLDRLSWWPKGYYRNVTSSVRGMKDIATLPCSLLDRLQFWGSHTYYHEDSQAALMEKSLKEEQSLPATSLQPTWQPCEGTILEGVLPSPVKPSDDVLTETSSEILSQNHQLSCSQTPDSQKLWDNKGFFDILRC